MTRTQTQHSHRKASRRERQAAALQRLLRRQLGKLTETLAVDLAPRFDKLGESAATSFLIHAGDSFPKSDGPDYIFTYTDPETKVVESYRVKATDRQLVDQIMRDLNLRDWTDRELKQSIARHWVRTGGSTVDAINRTTKLGVMLSAPAEAKLLAEGGRRAGLVDIEKDTKRAIFKGLNEGRDAGSSTTEVAKTIRQYVPAGRYTQLAKIPTRDGSNRGSVYRSRMIARAESKTAQNTSSLAAYTDHPNVNSVQAWDARVGDEHDPYCEQRDGQIFPLDEAAGEDLTQPNCSLSWSPVVE